MQALFKRGAVPPADFDPAQEKGVVAESLVRSAARLLGRHDEHDMIRHVCAALTQATPHIRLAWTWTGPVDTPVIKPQVVVGPESAYGRELVIERNRLTQNGPAFRTLSGKRSLPFKVSAFSLYGPWRDAARECGIRSSLSLCLTSEAEDHRGLLVLYADMADYFEQVGVGLFEAMADMFGAVLSVTAERVALERTAFSDALTGLLNRHAMDVVARPVLRAGAGDPEAAVLLIDIDHFKRVNDAFGHAGGDQVLQSVARLLRARLRSADSVLRWGGEEFLVCLPDTPAEGAKLVAHKLLDAFRHTRHALADGRQVALTASIGVAGLAPGCGFIEAVQRADDALYQAKRDGRNQVVTRPLPA